MNNSLAAALTRADKHSAPVTHLGQRVLWTIVTLAVLAGIYWLMWRGWKKRQAGQADIPPPQGRPESWQTPLIPDEAWDADAHEADPGDGFEAVYVSTTKAGDWLDRIAVHGFGNRSAAAIAIYPHGIFIDRSSHGEPDVCISAESIRGVKRTTGMAGKYLRDEGIVVITWQHGDHLLDTGVKPRYEGDRDELLRAVDAYLRVSVTERPAR